MCLKGGQLRCQGDLKRQTGLHFIKEVDKWAGVIFVSLKRFCFSPSCERSMRIGWLPGPLYSRMEAKR